jgi:2Fe-2S ferredoxin
LENEINIKVTDRNSISKNISGPTDMNLNLMELIKIHELPVEGTCGGMALCASCHIYINSNHKLIEKSHDEQAMLDESWHSKDNSRLACQIPLDGSIDNLEIELAPED